jgi:WD40 repeat protein
MNKITTCNYFSPLYNPKYKVIPKRIFIQKLNTKMQISRILNLSNKNYIIINYNSLYQYENISFEKKLFSLKETNEISNIIEIQSENSNEIIIAYSTINILKIYSLTNKKYISSFDDNEWSITSILEYKLNLILTSSNDKTIKLFDIKETYCIMNILAHSWSINKIIKLKNDFIASCSWDKSIKIWEFNEGYFISELLGHNENVNDIVEFKENEIISVSEDLSIRFWDWKNEKCLFCIENCHFDNILKVVKLNNYVFITYSEDGFVKFWDFEKKSEISKFFGDGYYIKFIGNVNNDIFAIWLNGIFVFSNQRILNL